MFLQRAQGGAAGRDSPEGHERLDRQPGFTEAAILQPELTPMALQCPLLWQPGFLISTGSAGIFTFFVLDSCGFQRIQVLAQRQGIHITSQAVLRLEPAQQPCPPCSNPCLPGLRFLESLTHFCMDTWDHTTTTLLDMFSHRSCELCFSLDVPTGPVNGASSQKTFCCFFAF